MVSPDVAHLIFLTLATILTSGIAAIIGQGGGLILFALLSLYLQAPELIVIHGIIQAFSNSSRSLLALPHIRWAIVRPILLGTILGAIFITPFIEYANWQNMLFFMGAYILFMTWGGKIQLPINLPFPAVTTGLMQGSLGMALGATGPLTNAILLAKGLSKDAIVATNAVIMTTSHIMKVLLFSLIGVSIMNQWLLILLLSIGAIVGSFLGHKVRGKIAEEKFIMLFKLVLSLLAIRMIFNSLYGLFLSA